MNLSVINVSIESFLLYPDEPPYVSCTSWKNYQADTDALNKNVVQYRGDCEWNVSQISISTNVVSTKWYHLGINAIFLQQKPGFI